MNQTDASHSQNQRDKWDREYRDPKMLTKKSEPQSDTKDFLRWLRREEGKDVTTFRVLDLGCGTGRNSEHLAEEGARVSAIDISETALRIARQRAEAAGLKIEYLQKDMGTKLAFADASFDLVLDVMSSNSLLADGRAVLLSEIARTAKPGAYLYFKTLCKDGDANAKALLQKHPGPEADTYVMPELGITERVFTEGDLRALYEPIFTLKHLEKKTNYNRINGRIYKRNYWVVYGVRK